MLIKLTLQRLAVCADTLKLLLKRAPRARSHLLEWSLITIDPCNSCSWLPVALEARGRLRASWPAARRPVSEEIVEWVDSPLLPCASSKVHEVHWAFTDFSRFFFRGTIRRRSIEEST